jgi:hypothetical protein
VLKRRDVDGRGEGLQFQCCLPLHLESSGMSRTHNIHKIDVFNMCSISL